jgi:WD40 repeat protein
MKNLLYALGLFIFTYYSYADYPWSASEAWRVQVKWGSDDLTTLRSYIKLSPDGKELVHFKPWDSTVVFYNPDTGELLRKIKTNDKVYGAVFSNNGKKVIYRGYTGRIKIASYPEFELEKELKSAEGWNFQYYENFNKVALIGGLLNLIDIDKDVILEEIGGFSYPISERPVYSISTNKVAYITYANINTQGEDCRVNVVDETGKLIFDYQIYCGGGLLADRKREIAVSNDGNLLVFHGRDKSIYIYDFRTGELRKTSPLDSQVNIFEFGKDDKYILAGLQSNGLKRIDVEKLNIVELGGGISYNLCFNSDTTAQYSLVNDAEIFKFNIKRANSIHEDGQINLVKKYSQNENGVIIELNDFTKIQAITVSSMQGKVLTSLNTFTSNTTQIDISTYPK